MHHPNERRFAVYVSLAIGLCVLLKLAYELGSWRMEREANWMRPNLPGCQLTPVGRYASDDGADLATLLKRDCDQGDSIKYFLRLDIGPRRAAPRGWFSFVELDNDRPESDPVVSWVKPHTVQVTMSTRTLSGRLVENRGEDITIVRVFAPREPGAFPNRR